jgi:hypothetical protein
MQKKLLFIRKNYDPQNLQRNDYCGALMNAESRIVQELKKDHILNVRFDLGEYVLDLLKKEAETGKAFDWMVTHVNPNRNEPPRGDEEPREDYYARYYGKSLRLLSEINSTYPKMPVIAYTGASDCPEMFKVFMKVGKLKQIVYVSSPKEWETDLRNLRQAIN